MGKPYAQELEQLHSTYAACMKMDISGLTKTLEDCYCLPLVAIGSGGSFTSALVAAHLHYRHTRCMALALTPLQFIQDGQFRKESAVLCVSAGGRNSDIRKALQVALSVEANKVIVACARKHSPLARLAEGNLNAKTIQFDLPAGTDGFLATNSLLAFSTLFTRAYVNAFGEDCSLPADLTTLMSATQDGQFSLAKLQSRCRPLWQAGTLIVLYGGATRAAAYDLESKCVEAALAPVLISDYRNFAHGRHHWLAKRGDSSAILALTSSEDRELAQKTLRLIPKGIPIVELDFPGPDPIASLAAITTVIYIVASAGQTKGIDPGRPGVPQFGQRLYNLRMESSSVVRESTSGSAVAIRRKTGALLESSLLKLDMHAWLTHYRGFVRKLTKIKFDALVLDYDGTLCDVSDRFGPLSLSIGEEIEKLLANNIAVGIATGRGKSVRTALQQTLKRAHWDKIVVGYYNGGECALLADEGSPQKSEATCDELAACAAALEKTWWSSIFSNIEKRKHQITLSAGPAASCKKFREVVGALVEQHGPVGTRVLTSDHSIDILAPGVSKLSVVHGIKNLLLGEDDAEILCIGDRGAWPGNDFELLREPHSLSVNEVSADPVTCWNLAPLGSRGVQAMLYYFRCMILEQDGFRLDFSGVKRRLHER